MHFIHVTFNVFICSIFIFLLRVFYVEVNQVNPEGEMSIVKSTNKRYKVTSVSLPKIDSEITIFEKINVDPGP